MIGNLLAPSRSEHPTLELALNIAWVLLGGVSVLVWTFVRRRSDSTLLLGYTRGLLVLGCILFVLFPVISISDDVLQTSALVEDRALIDASVTKESADLRQIMQAAALVAACILMSSFIFWRETHNGGNPPRPIPAYRRTIENRPPPQYFYA